MTSWSRTERSALCDLFLEVGSDAATLCEGWRTADLAAHLVIRERRLDAAVGILLPPARGYTTRVQNGYRDKSWGSLVSLVRSGPPAWSPLRLPPVEQAMNTVEFFIHHEDVRRAQDGWTPRTLDPRLQDALWSALTSRAKLFYRSAPVGLTLRREDGREHVVKGGPGPVVLAGAPAELLLHSYGRGTHAQVTVDGDAASVAALASARLGI